MRMPKQLLGRFDFIIINFCLKFVLTQFKDILILYDTLDSLQHVLMAIGASDSKLLQVFSIDFQILMVSGKWKRIVHYWSL